MIEEIATISNLHRAVQFARDDKQDEAIRDVLREQPYLLNLNAKLPDLSARLSRGAYQAQDAVVVELVKGSYTTRPLSQISLEDWIVAQAILNIIGRQVDSRIPDSSFSYRLNPNRGLSGRHKFFKAWYRQWPKFIRRIRETVSDERPCLVVTDIAGYFEHIDLILLREKLLEAEVPRAVVDLIFSQLERWTWRRGYGARRPRGLFQGNDVAGFYANFYLSDIDHHFTRQDIVYQRFMDDINIHVRTTSEAKAVLAELNREIRNLGLTLNAAKTHILCGHEEIETYFGFELSDRIELHLRRLREEGDNTALRRERRALFREITTATRVNEHLLRRLITAFLRAKDRWFLNRALSYLESRPAATSKLCEYFLALDGNAVAAKLLDFLEDPARNIFPSQEQELIDRLTLMNVTAALQPRIIALARSRVSDTDVDPYSKALYALLLYKFGDRAELEALVNVYMSGREKHGPLKKYLALAVSRLTDDALLHRVTDRLKREADPDLTDAGVFVEAIQAQSDRTATNLIDRINTKDHVYCGTTVSRMDVRNLILLNIARLDRSTAAREKLEAKLNLLRAKVRCSRTRHLLDEITYRL